jgi:hypothetical protein
MMYAQYLPGFTILKVWLRLLLLSLINFSIGGAAFAQDAELSGIVVDPQNGAVPKAEVRVTNQKTAIERVTKTNDSGFYSFPYLDPGIYQIFVQAAGFRRVVSDVITLSVGQRRLVKFQLTIGALSERIEVVATQSPIDTSDATVSTVIDRQFLANIPLNGRTFQSLMTLAPGVQTNVTSSGNQGQFAVNGQRANANYFTVDGVSANVGSWYFPGQYAQASAGTLPATNIQGGFNGLVSVDDLQEFQVLTSSFSPEFGRSPGAEVNMVTRSGTNTYHGELYEYFRNEAFDANDWFANSLGLPRAPLRLNNYGGTFGGPLRLRSYDGHAKTFFFFSFENQSFRIPTTMQSIVPSMVARQSAIPGAASILNAFPKPNGADIGLDGAMFDAAFGAPTRSYDTSLRIDHRFNVAYSIFGRFNYSSSSSISLDPSDLAEKTTVESQIQTSTVGATQTINSFWVNEIRANYTRSTGSAKARITSFGGAVPPPDSVLWPMGKAPAFGYSIFNIDNVGGLQVVGFQSGRENANVPHQYSILDNLSYLRRRHQFKFGLDYRLLRTDISPITLGSFVGFANPTDTTSGIATLNTGTASAIAIFNQAGETISYKAFSAYAQDVWRVTDRLTFMYGTRWEINPAPETVAGQRPFTACCAKDLSSLTLSPQGTSYYSATYRNFAPRVGLAYQWSRVPGHELVVRGGGGIYYDLGQSGSFGDNNWPYSNFLVDSEIPFPIPAAEFVFPPINPIPSPSNPAVVTIAGTHFRLPLTYEWNLTLEQALGTGRGVSVAYVGARGHDLLRSENYLNAKPDFSSVQVVTNNGFSTYDSLQVQFSANVAQRLQAVASYTYAHSIDNASSDSSNAIPAQFVKTFFDKGNSDFDVRHKFNAAFVYRLPAPQANKILNAILRNWSAQGIFAARTALPFDVVVADPQFVFDPRFTGTIRANLVPNQPLFLRGPDFPGGRSANPAAFTELDPGQVQGNLGRNRLRGFGLVQLDFSAKRRFNLRDKIAIEFGVEAFNVFNHPNFANPSSLSFTNFLGAPQFGQSSFMFGAGLGGGSNQGGMSPLFAIGGARDLQLALRFAF